MSGFSRLAVVEGKLFLREKAALIGVFGLPVALVIGFGLIPGFGDPQKGLSDQIGTEYIAALGVAILERGRIAALDTPAGLVDSAGGEYRMRFRPMAPLDEQWLTTLPGVTAVGRHGAHMTVTGIGDFASAVTAELARRQVVVADLRIEGRSLDSAYVALTGRSMDT